MPNDQSDFPALATRHPHTNDATELVSAPKQCLRQPKAVLRAFLACELPSSLQAAIQTATAGLRRALGNELIRWVPSQNVHLTLKFLGGIAPSSLEAIKAALMAEAIKCPAFDVRLGGSGCYPNPRRPRVLWIGVDAPSELAGLQNNLEIETTQLGYASEKRAFSPHLTIGRVRENPSMADLQKIGRALEQMRIGDIGVARLEKVHLFSSDLRPTGAAYTKLLTAQLGVG